MPRTSRAKSKEAIITFKVTPEIATALRHVDNRSEFIRAALAAALSRDCPLCLGIGVIPAARRRHWDQFAASHALEECRTCHEPRLVCRSTRRRATCPTPSGRRRTKNTKKQ